MFIINIDTIKKESLTLKLMLQSKNELLNILLNLKVYLGKKKSDRMRKNVTNNFACHFLLIHVYTAPKSATQGGPLLPVPRPPIVLEFTCIRVISCKL